MSAMLYPLNILVEGYTDEVVVRRILDYVGLPCGMVYGKEGKSRLLERLPHYNQAARFRPWLAVIDLDLDESCAPTLIQNVLPQRSDGMLLRVAVRAIEAWLLADAERLAAFLNIALSRVPLQPDAESNPKTSLVNLARHRRSKTIVADMVPRQGSGARVGPGYPSRLIEFVTLHKYQWRPEVAMQSSESLQRCIAALEHLKRND
jgi:hypothetical protein